MARIGSGLMLVDELGDLITAVDKFVKKKDTNINITRRENNTIEKIEQKNDTLELAQTEIIQTLVNLVAKRENFSIPPAVNVVTKPANITNVVNVPKTEPTNVTGIINKLQKGNEIKAEFNSLFRAFAEHSIHDMTQQTNAIQSITEQLSLANELKTSEILSHFETSVSIITAINGMTNQLKTLTDIQMEVSTQIADNMDKYFNQMALYFDFKNTGAIATAKKFLDTSFETEEKTFLRDREGQIIVPREIETLAQSETFIEKRDLNDTDFSDFVSENDYQNPFDLLKNVFEGVNLTIPTNLQEGE